MEFVHYFSAISLALFGFSFAFLVVVPFLFMSGCFCVKEDLSV